MKNKFLLMGLFLAGLNLPAQAQWGSGTFKFFVSGNATAKTDSIRLKGGGSTTITLSGHTVTISSTVAAGSVDSTSVVNGGLTTGDYRTASITREKIAANAVEESEVNWAQQNVDSVSSRVRTATPTAKGLWYLKPIQASIDTATTLAADTTWFWKNTFGATITVDSIQVDASADNFAITFLERNEHGGNVATVDAVTASTNGTNTFYITETTITGATIEATHWIGFLRPTTVTERASFLIFYH